jgi:hypothetical protein
MDSPSDDGTSTQRAYERAPGSVHGFLGATPC